MAFIPGVQNKVITLKGKSGVAMRDKTAEELELSKKQKLALKDYNGNIRIPFLLMIKQKDEPFIRDVDDMEMTFGPGSTGNVLLGRSFSYNAAGENVKFNSFYQRQDIIEVDSHKPFFVRLRIAYQVFKLLKY